MEFNITKCKVMHLGKNNPETAYSIQGVKLQRVQEEKDLGIFLNEVVKVGTQCGKAAAKGNQILGLIHRTIVSRDKRVITGLYKSGLTTFGLLLSGMETTSKK